MKFEVQINGDVVQEKITTAAEQAVHEAVEATFSAGNAWTHAGDAYKALKQTIAGVIANTNLTPMVERVVNEVAEKVIRVELERRVAKEIKKMDTATLQALLAKEEAK